MSFNVIIERLNLIDFPNNVFLIRRNVLLLDDTQTKSSSCYLLTICSIFTSSPHSLPLYDENSENIRLNIFFCVSMMKAGHVSMEGRGDE